MSDPKPRKPPPQEEMDHVHGMLFRHGPDVRVAVLAKAMGRRNRGATGRTLRALEEEDLAVSRLVFGDGAPYRVYTAVAAKPRTVPAAWLVRVALRCFERGLLSAYGTTVHHRSVLARELWDASPERAGLVETVGRRVVESEEAKDRAEQDGEA